MQNVATTTATETVVRIGKGLTFHAQLRGVDAPAAACGTVSRTFGAERHVQGTVSCRKCLDAIEAETEREEAFAAQQARSAEIEAEEAAFTALVEAEAAEEVHAALLLEDAAAEIAAEVEARRAEEATLPAVATLPVQGDIKKGDVVTLIADGQGWTVRRILKDGTLRLINEDGKKINRKASAVTK